MIKERSKLSNMNNMEKEVLLAPKSERVEMTLNTESALASGLLIQRLTELYEDPVEATVRETISNAIDAVILAYSGVRPVIKISSPTTLNPILTIKDNGIGMTYEDLKEIYSKYGASTKINDLEQIGAYGLGAKAPLAYGTEFTVTSVKDNQKTTIIVAREELTNYIKIVDSVYTDEPSGTTVSIPINSQDIQRFCDHVNKYATTPIDKDVDIVINGTKVEKTSFVEISNKVKIHNGKAGSVYGRVWVDPMDTVDLLLNLPDYKIADNISYIIGGWVYPSPARRNGNSYYQRGKGILVELKAGIVGFNSSRDAILENERYSELEKLVKSYIQSDQFSKDIIEAANNLDKEIFKQVLANVMRSYRNSTALVNGKFETNVGRYSSSQRQINLDYFLHNETGFKSTSIISAVPTGDKQTAVFRENKVSHVKTTRNGLMDGSYYNLFTEVSSRQVSDTLTDIIINKEKSHDLSTFMFNLYLDFAYPQSKRASVLTVNFVTDLKSDENIEKLIKSKKALFNSVKPASEHFISIMVYTEHSKKDIENMIKSSGLEPIINLAEYLTEEEALTKIQDFKIATRTVNVKRERVEIISTRLNKYLADSNDYKNSVTLSSIDENRKNIFIATRNTYTNSNKMSNFLNWYCNENDVERSTVDLYMSVGLHSVADLDTLFELGEVFSDPTSESAGRSKKYDECVASNPAGTHIVLNSEVPDENYAIAALLQGAYENEYNMVSVTIGEKLKDAEKIAKIAGVKFPSIKNLKLIKILEDGHKSTKFAGNDYKSAFEHLITFVSKENYSLVNDLMKFSRYNSGFTIDKEGNYSSKSGSYDIMPYVHNVVTLYESDFGSDFYTKLEKLKVEASVEFMASIVERMSAIK